MCFVLCAFAALIRFVAFSAFFKMAYYLNLFSPETYEAFTRSDRSVSGFRPRHRHAAERIKPGDRFVCYMTKLSRWVGILQVESEPFIDDSPRFYPDNDPSRFASVYERFTGYHETGQYPSTKTRSGIDSRLRKVRKKTLALGRVNFGEVSCS